MDTDAPVSANAAENDEATSAKEPALFGMLIRDLAVVFAALSIWAAADAW